MSRSFVAVLVIASLGWAAVARAQEFPGWRVSGGGGIGTTVYRGDEAGRGSAAGVARLGIEPVTGAGLDLAVEWIGGSLSGDLRGGAAIRIGGATELVPAVEIVVQRAGGATLLTFCRHHADCPRRVDPPGIRSPVANPARRAHSSAPRSLARPQPRFSCAAAAERAVLQH